MDIRQLRYLISILEHRSIAAAAASLHVAPSALGAQMRNLEEELGVQLLLRHARGVEATPAGAVLLEHANKILLALEHAATETREAHMGTGMVTQVRLGLTPPINDFLSVALLRALRASHPLLRVGIVEAPSLALGDRVKDGWLDLACVYDLDNCDGLERTQLIEDELVFVQAREDQGETSPILLHQAATVPLVLPALSHRSREILETQAALRNLRLNVVYEVQSLAAMRELVLNGEAATITPFASVARYLGDERLCIRSLIEPRIPRPLWLVGGRNGTREAAVAGVASLLTEMLQNEIAQARAAWGAPHRERPRS
jgi:LysR family nitrogen assimilation transcriptional regulator